MKQFMMIFVIGVALVSAKAEASTKPKLEDSWFCKSLADEGTLILKANDEYRVWGCSAVYDDEGKVHVYYSKIPINGNWLVNSEIGHAVADHPEGPYKELGTIMRGRPGYWDANTIHNPTVYRVGKQYVLLYIGNDVSKAETWRDRAQAANTQRIGMAISDSPYGPWKRSDKPVINVSLDPNDWDEYCVVNPGFVHHPNGQYWIYYRAWDRNHDDRRKTGVAFADQLEGPYKKYEQNPIIDHFEGVKGQTEDPTMFYYQGKFHCIIRDMGNWDWLSSLYLTSEDGLNWSYPQRAKHPGYHYYDTEENKRCERDQVLMKDGKPQYLLNAVQRSSGNCGGILKLEGLKEEISWESMCVFIEDANITRDMLWSIKDNVLIGKGDTRGYLYTPRDYTNVHIRLEWRWPDADSAGKGGVLLRTTGEHKIWPKSLEAQINADSAGDFWGLQGYTYEGPADRYKTLEHDQYGFLTNLQKISHAEKPPGQWNQYEIIAQGDTVTLIVNGQEVNQAKQCPITSGKICITAEGTEIHYRNLEIRSLD